MNKTPLVPNKVPISIAPMMDKTNRHFRYFLRLLSKHVLLYTEMITSSAIIHGKQHALLDFHPIEHPLVLQIGGSDPDEIARAIEIAEEWNYDAYNLNVGCPSDRVQHRKYGACLMAEPQLVARIVQEMRSVTTKPISVKHRIGISSSNTDLTQYKDMQNFVQTLEPYCKHFTIHARIALLEGLSPKENRQIPPLRYNEVYRLKRENPSLCIEINGGIRSFAEIDRHLQYCDAVMLGRIAYERPWLLSGIDKRYFPQHPSETTTPRTIIQKWFNYIVEQLELGINPRSLVWPILELFAGKPGSRKWKQALSNSTLSNKFLENCDSQKEFVQNFLNACLESAPEALLNVTNAMSEEHPKNY